ncbi:MAG: hypothetical protein HQM12_19065, partial [SAR324 cluster bacterium]|nr:hypothetical protein [SAR324 cluster bacterium]
YLGGKFWPGVSLPGMDMITYSHHDGSIVKTIVNVNASFTHHLNRNVTLRVGHSQHIMAQNLRDLGLDQAKPVLIQATHTFQSRLNEGIPWRKWSHKPVIFE